MASKVFWLSFCDPEKPAGTQFLGGCVLEVTAEEAQAVRAEVRRRFPMALPDAEWFAAATRKARELGCNPGGEVAFAELPPNHPMLAHYPIGVLLDRASIEAIDAVLPMVPDETSN